MNITTKDTVRIIAQAIRGLTPVMKIVPLKGGIVNESWKVCGKSRTVVLQKVNTGLGKEQVNDILTLQQYPSMQDIIPGTSCLDHEGDLWKIVDHIEHDENTKLTDESAASAAGYLGHVHKKLKTCSFIPRTPIPGFHDSQAIFAKLAGYSAQGLPSEILWITIEVLALGQKSIESEGPGQLIHGDPKFDNFLFDEEGRAQALIDWDTLMSGNPLIDVGDMARSMCRLSDGTFCAHRFAKLCAAYRETAGTNQSDEEVLGATKLITLELAARFLIDYVENTYFSWDKEKFTSRRESNLAAAQKYLAYYKTMP